MLNRDTADFKLMTPTQMSDPPTVEQVLGQLDAEIANLRHKEALGGWSPWVLLASFAAVVALLLPMWEEKGFASSQTACTFLSVWFVVDALFPWFTAGSAWFSKGAQNIPQRPGYDFKDRRPLMVLVFLRYVLIVGLLIATYEHVSQFVYGNTFKASGPMYNGVFYSFHAVRIAYIFCMTWSSKPIADHDGRAEGVRIIHHILDFDRYFIMCFSLCLLPTAYLYVAAGGLVPGEAVPTSTKAGVLVAVLLYLILWFVDLRCRAPLIDRLLQLRREAVMRSVSPHDALKRMSDIVPTEKDHRGRIIIP